MSQSEQTYTTSSGGSSQTSTEAHSMLQSFWTRATEEIRNLTANDFKQQELPLARIKKIMKLDEDVKMISAEAPVLFAKAAEIFITELSLRAWIHTEDNKRRTLQRNDIAMAITKFDQFDFLIDIVPRDELKPAKRQEENVRTATVIPEQVQYYLQLAQQHQAAMQQQNPQQQGPTQIQILQPGGHVQTVTTTQAIPNGENQTMTQVSAASTSTPVQVQVQQPTHVQTASANQTTQSHVIQIQQPQNVQAAQQVQQAGVQIVQVVTNTGEIQQIPIQLTQAQLQLIRMQMQGQSANQQPMIIQAAAPLQATTPHVQGGQTVYQIQVPGQAQGPTPVFLTSTNAQGQQTIQIQQPTVATVQSTDQSNPEEQAQ
jgi:nuclear transcription factor Y gamma